MKLSPIIQSLIIVAVSALFGFGYNAIRNDSLPLIAVKEIVTGEDVANVDSLLADTTVLSTPLMIDLSLAKQLYDRGTTFVDARDEEEYRAGYITGALNASAPQLATRVRPDDPLVIYCSGEGCDLSIELSETLMLDWGFTKIFVFDGGWPEWTEAGYPTEIGE